MRNVFIVGIGQTPVTKGKLLRGRYMAREAIGLALQSASLEPADVTALFVGNMMAGMLGRQQQLGPLYADAAGLRGVESMTLEAACGSGAAAVRVGYSAIAGGLHDVVVICGMERMTQAPREDITMALAIERRVDKLRLAGAELSSQRAFAQAKLTPQDIDIFELHDAYTVITALSLEAAGFAGLGEGIRLADEGAIAINGRLPISTMGGLKARGHPVGATGVYQMVETVQQLTGEAGANQVAGAKVAMVQNIGGTGATVMTHILRA